MTGPRLDIAIDGKRFDFLPEPLLERFDLVVEPPALSASTALPPLPRHPPASSFRTRGCCPG